MKEDETSDWEKWSGEKNSGDLKSQTKETEDGNSQEWMGMTREQNEISR